MLKQKLFAVDYGPGHVFEGSGAVFVGFDVVLGGRLFLRKRWAAEGCQVKDVNDFGVGFPGGDPLMNAARI